MSYELIAPDKAYRLGDIVEGFVLGAADLDSPSIAPMDYQIRITLPRFAAVLTPCCSVGQKTLSLAPLVKVNPRFFENGYFAADLARINRPMWPKETVSEALWNRLPEDERQRRLGASLDFAVVEIYIYEPNDFLPAYAVTHHGSSISVQHYMIDFRSAHRVDCKQVVKPNQVPLGAKLLQLSRDSRGELREKLGNYFARIPKEDEV